MMPKNSWKKGKEIVAAPLCAHKSNEGTTYCVKCGEEADGVLWPLSPSPEIRRNALKDDVIAKARCIRHWHDTGRNGEGMVVSSEAVRALWTSLAELDRLAPPTEPASTSR